MTENHLEQAERHVREGTAKVARQHEIVEQLKAGGHDVEQAEALLSTLEEVLAGARDHLVRVRSRQSR